MSAVSVLYRRYSLAGLIILGFSHLVFLFVISPIIQCNLNPRRTMFLKKNYSISTKVFNELRLYYNSQNSSPLCNILSQTGLVRILTPYISKINCNTIFLIIKANKMHYFSDLFDKVLYMFRTGPLSIIRSISTLYTRSRYLSC